MFRRRATVVCVIIGFAASANADQAACKIYAPVLEPLGPAMRDVATGLEGQDTSKISENFDGEQRAALEKMEALRKQLLPLLKAYADQIEDTAYVMKKCARD
ncbi:hypothetical protein [Rhizobium sp. SG570]|uniref:hypothetical protein n=1 Tax=Rhizobium sp. SG570 TaxID=2587113 RepID=UPI001446684E|nr:hypothetical protein [Rhizobium sp. SG570]NKJ34132.1 hypothetical protein [Rhizobium sp. SG570]